MAYHRSLDGTFNDLLKCGKGIVGAAVDPYLPEVMCRLEQLKALNTGRTPMQMLLGKKPAVAVPACAVTPSSKKSGAGLDAVSKALGKLVYLNQHPTLIWLGLSAALAIPLLIGVSIGRKSRR